MRCGLDLKKAGAMTNQLNSRGILWNWRHYGSRPNVAGTLFEQAAVGVSISRHDGAYLDMNNVFARLSAIPKEELLHKNFREITHLMILI